MILKIITAQQSRINSLEKGFSTQQLQINELKEVVLQLSKSKSPLSLDDAINIGGVSTTKKKKKRVFVKSTFEMVEKKI